MEKLEFASFKLDYFAFVQTVKNLYTLLCQDSVASDM